jgi:hypothetical protein
MTEKSKELLNCFEYLYIQEKQTLDVSFRFDMTKKVNIKVSVISR